MLKGGGVLQRANSSSLGPSEWQLPVESGHTHTHTLMHAKIPPTITLSKVMTDILFLSVSVRLLPSSPGGGSQLRFPRRFTVHRSWKRLRRSNSCTKSTLSGKNPLIQAGNMCFSVCVQLAAPLFFFCRWDGGCQWLLLEKRDRANFFFPLLMNEEK